MSHVERITGPSPADPQKGKGERSAVNPDSFKQFMVEEVGQVDPEQKRKQKKFSQEEDVEDAKQAIAAAQPGTATPIESVDSPLKTQQTTTSQAPAAPTPQTAGYTPLASFSADEIEGYAWEEEQQQPAQAAPPQTGLPAPPPYQSSQQESGSTTAPYTPPPAAEPSYASSDQWNDEEEDVPPPTSPRYSTEGAEYDQENPWQQSPPSIPQTTSSPSSEQSKEQKEKDQEKAAPSQPQAVTGKQPKQPPVAKPKKVSLPAGKPPKITVKEDAASQAPTAPSKKPRSARTPKKTTIPMLGKEEKPGKKQGSTDFKKMMEEPGAAPKKETQPEEPSSTSAQAPKTKGASAAKSQKPSPKVSGVQLPKPEGAPVQEKPSAKDEATSASPQGVLSGEIPSLKKEATGKIPTKKGDSEGAPSDVESAGFPVPMAAQPQPPSEAPMGEEKGKRSGKDLVIEELGGVPSTLPPFVPGIPTIGETAPVASTAPYAELNMETLALIARSVGIVTVMQTAGITETSFTLSDAAFAGSKLAGATITIKTFDTAPGQLNIEFSGSSEALAMMQQNLPSLMAAFQAGNYNFTVKRCDFIFQRKEAPRERGGEQKQRDREKREEG